MGTRGFIGRTTEPNESVPGVYHHWDSYPSGLGSTLYAVIRGHFRGDIAAALAYLIDDHPAGWSTINGKDFALTPGFTEHDQEVCDVCERNVWEHYRQYYEGKGIPVPADAEPVGEFGLYHRPIAREHSQPECYCHGGRNEEAWDLTLDKAAGSGCEYAYIISPESRTMYVLSSYCDDGEKMIGMFGMGDEGAEWKQIREVDLDGPEPYWERMGDA